MELFEKVYLGNTLQDWLIAGCVLVSVFAVLKFAQCLTIRKLSKLAATTDNQVDDLLVNILKQTKLFVLLFASTYAAFFTITLEPPMMAMWQKAVLLILIVQGGLWAGAGISFAVNRTVQRRTYGDTTGATTMIFIGFIARVILWTIVLLLILDNLGVNITGLVAGLGIGGIAVALAVQNVLGDLLASLSIVLDKPFIIGDFVVVDALSGTIEHIGLKTTRIRSLSGEQLIFSNNDLLKSRIRNYKRMAERRVLFNFGVTYQTPLLKLKSIKQIVKKIVANTENVRFERVHFKEYGDFSLNFEVVYFVTNPDYALYMDVQESINLELFRRFEEEGIEFAYPTQTLFIQREAS